MTFRKVIKFGESSYVISIPKNWIERNSLKKGDVLKIEETPEKNLVVSLPTTEKAEKAEKKIAIELKDFYSTKEKIVSAYLNNYTDIRVTGNLLPEIENLRRLVLDLAGLEIIEQTPNKLVLRDFLDISNVKVKETIRRIDLTISSMIDDLRTCLSANELSSVGKTIYQKEKDINRLYYVMYKMLKRAIETGYPPKEELLQKEVYYYLEIIISLEEIADQIKRITKTLNKIQDKKKFIDHFEKLAQNYKSAMKSYHTANQDLAIETINNRFKIFHKNNRGNTTLTASQEDAYIWEKLKNMNGFIGNIAKAVTHFNQ